MLRDWAWELAERGYGPDHLCVLRFVPEDAARLATLVQQQPPPHLVLDRMLEREENAQPTDTFCYVDRSTAAQMAADQAAGSVHNYWFYQTLTVCHSHCIVEHGYGAPAPLAETEWLIWLSTQPHLHLSMWQILGGGEGYAPQVVAEGTTASSLVAYIQGRTPKYIMSA